MSSRARTILILLAAIFLAFSAWRSGNNAGDNANNPPAYQEEAACPGTALVARAEAERLDKAHVYGQGEVVRVLPDDTKGIGHQRFLLRVAPGLTVLVAHNTDLAPPIDRLTAGDRLAFCGEYIWNSKGGVLHWTHHDPAGRRPGGWLRSHGKLYR